MTKAKPKYEAPLVAQLDQMAQGRGDCADGASVTDTCVDGAAVTGTCTNGGVPVASCQPGTSPAASMCSTGGQYF